MNKNVLLTSMMLALALTACSEDKAASVATAPEAVAEQPAAAALSTGNGPHVLADMDQLNGVMNTFTVEAERLNEDLIAARQTNNAGQLKAIMAQLKASTQRMNDDLSHLGLQSQDVDDVRAQMIDANRRSMQLYDLAAQDEHTAEDKQKITDLSQQVQAIQMSVGQALMGFEAAYVK